MRQRDIQLKRVASSNRSVEKMAAKGMRHFSAASLATIAQNGALRWHRSRCYVTSGPYLRLPETGQLDAAAARHGGYPYPACSAPHQLRAWAHPLCLMP